MDLLVMGECRCFECQHASCTASWTRASPIWGGHTPRGASMRTTQLGSHPAGNGSVLTVAKVAREARHCLSDGHAARDVHLSHGVVA
jgi:hypothetical protein